jgi:serine/threonine protein kinase
MNVTESTPNVIDVIAEEFVERYRRGERPAISEYEARYPEQAEAIRDLFPALVVMERLKPASRPVPTSDQAQCASEVASLGRLGDYRIVREVGRGGMGIVYEAVQESLGRKVALKVLPKQLVGDESRQARFDREARAAARLHHTNIVPVFGVGQECGLHYYAMQYIHGLGLDEVLRELRRLKSPGQEPSSAKNGSRVPVAEEPRQAVTITLTQALITGQFEAGANASESPPAVDLPSQPAGAGNGASDTAKDRVSQTLRLSDSLSLPGAALSGKSGPGRGNFWQSVARMGVQVSEALHYAHEQGVLHRDVKPSNLLLDTRGTVWVTDFGLAKADDQQDLTQTGDVVGTLRYMAPEMFSGKADRRSDVYSLGLTLYELLALRPAFDEADRGRLIRLVLNETPPRLRTLDPSIPRDLETILHKAIDREPSHRYATAQDLADDLKRFLSDEPIRARRISLATRFSRWCKRNPAVASLTSAIAILLLVATGVSLAAAMIFQRMARDNSKLAVDLKSALTDAQKHLADVKKQEQLARGHADRANANLRLAIQAVNEMYTEVSENWLKATPRMQKSRRYVLERALEFYHQFAERNSDPDLRLETALAWRRIGEIRHRFEENQDAQAALTESAKLLEALIAEFPGVSRYDHELATVFYFTSKTLEVRERHQESEEFARRAVVIEQRLLQSNPKNLEYRAAAAQFTHQWGHALDHQEKVADALRMHKTALEMYTALRAEQPQQHSYVIQWAHSCAHVAGLLHRSGEHELAEQKYVNAISSLSATAGGLENNADVVDSPGYLLACAHHRYGDFLRDRGRNADAETSYCEAVRLMTDQVTAFPEIGHYRMMLGSMLASLGRLRADADRQDEAIPSLEEALRIFRELSHQSADMPEYGRFVDELQTQLATLKNKR